MAAGKRKPSRHTEIERKFAVVDSTVSPSFDGLSAVGRVEQLPVAHLDAVYFDTPDHDLAAHKITLRRRTGGTDAGWHLKLPAGADARTEVRLPITAARESVPDELRDIVLAIVRDRSLQPVARIETERTVSMLYTPDDTELAEFCDDRVTATAGESLQNWREWELELVGADSAAADSGPEALDRLANRLFDAGAQPAGHGSKLAKVLAAARGGDAPQAAPEPTDKVHRAIAAHIAELIDWDRAVRADAFDSVHQMRVTIRKIRSLLQETGNLGEREWVLDELKLLAAVLGTARDALAKAGLSPVVLGPKEGLALLNGTQCSTALALAGLFAAEAEAVHAPMRFAALVDRHDDEDRRTGQRGRRQLATDGELRARVDGLSFAVV